MVFPAKVHLSSAFIQQLFLVILWLIIVIKYMISYQTESHLAEFILKGWSIFSVYSSHRFGFSDQM